MSGQQAYIYQKHNRLPEASVIADVSPSAKPPLIYPVSKRGNGNIRVYGRYNGDTDARYDVRILDTALEVPVVSAPTFRGAGTGKISGITVDGLQAQKVHVLCLSTGTDTTHAEIEIEGRKFRAKAEGTPGNAIYIIIDDSTLVYTPTDYSTIKALKPGDTALEGQEWDFGTKVLQGTLVPQDAHRIAFGLDRLHIYVQYKKFEEGKWKYYFILPIQYDVKPGSRVYFVTGGRKVTVTNGVTTEEYTGIVTIADFWQKVRNSSAILEPAESSIDTSRAVSSPAVREFATKTDAYFLPPYRDEKSSVYAGELENIGVTNSAKTELIEIKCAENAYIGAEIWNVRGSSGGDMGQARTGQLANFGHVSFLVPQRFPEDWGQAKEDWSHKVTYASRPPNTTPPPICFAMRLGINSVPQTLIIEYKKKPPECTCPTVVFSDKCLGLQEEGGETGMAYVVEDLVMWTDMTAEIMKEGIKTYTGAEAEIHEGRQGRRPPSPLWEFDAITREYFTLFKALAQRIMNLPEEAPAQLQAMVSGFKTLVNSVNLTTTKGSLTWDGAAWSGAGYLLYAMTTDQSKTLDVKYDTNQYKAVVEGVLLYEKTHGLKKNNVVAPGTCYIDAGGEYYWEVRGSRNYLPAFTDTHYYSTVKQSCCGGGFTFTNTKEFAFLVSTPCGGALLEGDTIEVQIKGSAYERTYQIGDITYLPTIAKQNLYLHGGIDGDDLYTFSVRGDLNTFPDYLLDRDNPQRYYQPNLAFMVDDGIIPFQVGDMFEFAVEGGHFAWRRDGGAWSAARDIRQDLQALDSGLSIGFDFGVDPSFVQNDAWEILCYQENKAMNLTTPWQQAWKGTGNLVFGFPAQVTIDALVIDQHDLTGTVTFQASDHADFSVLLHNQDIPVSPLICRLYPDGDAITAKYFRLLISGEHSIGYVFLGAMMRLGLDADSIKPLRRFSMKYQEAKKPFSLFEKLRKGFNIQYSSYIGNADFVKLDEMIEYLKSKNDMPFYCVANVNYPDSLCLRGKIDADNIEPGSDIDLNAPEENRIYSITIPVAGV